MEKNKSISCICPISIFGPVEKFVFLSQADVLIELEENFQKRSMRNRTKILSANGPLLLSIPLKKGKTKSKIIDVVISYDENWVKDYLEGIKSSYASAPYFEYYFDSVASIISERKNKLIDLFNSSFAFLQKQLDFSKVKYTTNYNPSYDKYYDLRKTNGEQYVELEPYQQVFSDRFSFQAELSVLDLLFNLGPEASLILKNSKIKEKIKSKK